MSTKLDNQTYFDKTIEYLRNQPTRCVNKAGNCVLRNEDGNACAVGYWIPDGHMALNVTGGVLKLAQAYPELAGVAWPKTGKQLARALQSIHDFPKYRDLQGGGLSGTGEKRARETAEDFGLVYTPPEETP